MSSERPSFLASFAYVLLPNTRFTTGQTGSSTPFEAVLSLLVVWPFFLLGRICQITGVTVGAALGLPVYWECYPIEQEDES